MESTRFPVSSTLISADLRKSHIETVEEFSITDASHVPFSEKNRALSGPPAVKLAALVPLLTSKILIWPSVPPAATRWPSGWNLTQVKAAGEN